MINRVLLIIICIGALSACNGDGKKGTTGNETSTGDSSINADQYNKNPETESELAASGAVLIEKSDCKTCHQVDTKIVGPAYVDVAKKYSDTEENVQYLAGKIIKGGAGVWGDVPMSPHPDISSEDAKVMAKYILSLNSGK